MNKSNNIRINSFNTRGMRATSKRQSIFHWLNTTYSGITLIQESHSVSSDEQLWQKEWGGQIYFSHGEFNARGVAILIPKEYNDRFEYIEGHKDNNGRFLLLNCKIDKNPLIIVNLYSPTKDKHSAQLNFIENIKPKIDEYSDKNIIIGGDLNTYLDINLDKKGGKTEQYTAYNNTIHSICEELNLVDIWRIRNPNTKTFTRRENSKSGLIQSRLDYFLISNSLSYLITNTEIKPGLMSDHSLVGLVLEMSGTSSRGRGYWKFNNTLLMDLDYIDLIKLTIDNIKKEANMTDKCLLWEHIKCQIRTETVRFSIRKAKNQNKLIKILTSKIENLEKNLDLENDKNNPKYTEYLQVKGEWEKLIKIKTNGIILRSKAKWCEEGEKNTKYFLNLEKRNYNQKCIKKLIGSNGTEITDQKEIIDEQRRFYEDLYSSKLKYTKDNESLDEYFLNNKIPTLNEELKNICDQELTIEECGKALKQLENNKSPGADGLTTNFYKFFWPDIKNIVYESYLYSEKNGNLSYYQKLGILNIMPKENKDIRYLKNWRPISLLTTDYKILTKALASRLQKVLPSLINPDQVGYMKNRFIGQNVRTIFDLMELTNTETIEAYIAQIDFEKAFDSIEWPFLFKTLKSFGFGENFINWIRVFYNDISSCVGNNGFYSSYFKLKRSIRQGCPISALLFLLVAEILAINIRNDISIKGIHFKNEEFKINLMADDATLFLTDIVSLANSIITFSKFGECSGLKLNLQKTEIIPIGNVQNKKINLPSHLNTIKVKHGPFKALGVWYSYNQEEVIKLNLDDRIKKLSTILNIWRSRNLSLKGKITIIKTLAIPQLQFLFNMIYIPDYIIKQIDNLVYNFLWNSKPAKIKKSTIIAPIKEGGLGMIDTHTIHQSAKISWIRRLFQTPDTKWKTLTLYMLNTNLQNLNKNPGIQASSNAKTKFHIQILQAWYTLIDHPLKTVYDIINQYIANNQYIKIQGKSLTNQNFKITNLDTIKLYDLVNEQGKFLSRDLLNQKLKCNLKPLQMLGLHSSIPKMWKEKLKTISDPFQMDKIIENNEPYIKVGIDLKPLKKISNKQIVNKLLKNIIKTPTSIETWINMFPFLEIEDWNQIFSRTFQITKETYLQSFQYKILNRILNCNERLQKWKIKSSNKCDDCGEVDSIEHHLYFCATSKTFWKKLKTWLIDNLGFGIELTVCEIIFGIPAYNNPDLKLINFVILIGKWYLNHSKTQNKSIYFLDFISLIKEKTEILRNISIINNEEVDSWVSDLWVVI